ncbi:MAG: site-2 protease family protein [Archaeoglobaceae archaeon]
MQVDSMLWPLIAFLLYWTVIEILNKRGILEKHGFKSYGPILMLRTKRGLELVEKISKARILWKFLTNLGIPMLFFAMFFMLLLVIFADIVMILSPPQPSELTSPQASLLIPGINPFIPLVWGFIGLVIAIVVHEMAHAILCRVEGIKVKALGLILALFPIGAFAEPDETELLDKKTKRISKIRIFSAGVTGNFLVAFIAFAVFFHFLQFLNPVPVVVDDNGAFVAKVLAVNGEKAGDLSKLIKVNELNLITLENSSGRYTVEVYGVWGVKVTGLYREDNKVYPAELAGIKSGSLITKVDGKEVRSLEDFRKEMGKRKPGQEVEIEVYDPTSNSFETFRLILAENNGRAFIGVYLANFECVGGVNFFNSAHIVSSLSQIPSQLKDPVMWLLLISIPFQFRGFMGLESFFDNEIYIFWVLNALYWTAWINFYVALFNSLPASPLDGGRVFQETLSAILRKLGERGEKISSQITKAMSIFVFASIAMMILVPNLANLR